MRFLALALLTTTASAQFVLQNSNLTASFRGIHALSDKIAWVSGTEGTVLRTTDGGRHWLPCAMPPAAEKLDFRGIQAFDENTAIVMSSGKGGASRLYKTTDACETWTLLLSNPDKDGFWDALRMWTPTEGFLAGDPVGGGMTLLQSTSASSGFSSVLDFVDALPHESAFAASNASIVLGERSQGDWVSHEVWFATGGESGSRVHHFSYSNEDENRHNTVKTTDVPFFPKSASAGIFAIARRGRLLITVGGDYRQPEVSTSTAAYSSNAGIDWQPAQTPPHGYRSSVAWSEDLKAFLTVGPNGTDISYDNGRTWQPAGTSTEENSNWNALSLPFVVGPKGRIGKLDPAAFRKR